MLLLTICERVKVGLLHQVRPAVRLSSAVHIVGALVEHLQAPVNFGLFEAHPGLDEIH